jgi:hypothetical protein
MLDPTLYKIAYDNNGIQLFEPIQDSNYHTSRWIEVNRQLMYANSGITEEVLGNLVNKILEYCNADKPVSTFRTDIAYIANAIKYHMAYPVDEKASIRLGATLYFFDNEDPNQCYSHLIDQKVTLAHQHADLYTFFLSKGLQNMPKYALTLGTSNVEDYLSKRAEGLRQHGVM